MTKVQYQSENTPRTTWVIVPPTEWGKDHWSTLAFLEAMAVDNKGLVKVAYMRTDPDIHPKYDHDGEARKRKKYPTRLRDRSELTGHDDWSCMEDMIDARMMFALMRDRRVWIFLTPFGTDVAGALRAYKAWGGLYRDFSGYYFDMETEGGKDVQSTDSN